MGGKRGRGSEKHVRKEREKEKKESESECAALCNRLSQANFP